MTEPKEKFPAERASALALDLIRLLQPFCEPTYLAVAGSLRRQKPMVGDIEIMMVPRIELVVGEGEMFATPTNMAAKAIDGLCLDGWIAPRGNSLGHTTWGELIKLAFHWNTSIPIDFFTATRENWWNYMVCRTGPAELNMRIAKAANDRGYKWKPYSPGFSCLDDPAEECVHVMLSERQVFEFVNIPYLEPHER